MIRFYTVFLILILGISHTYARTHSGLDVVAEKGCAALSGKRIGLICNQTSRTASGEFGPDVMLASRSWKLAAIFVPEHGLSGTRTAGATSDSSEYYHGIPVYSLYGSTRRPTAAMLKGIDVLVFDIQDIGVRSYTYISTMVLAMEAAAKAHIGFVVLDRPDPLGGERIEGNLLDTSLRSFVGMLSLPYIYGLTPGELARMAKGEKWFAGANELHLTVIEMQGWKRTMMWKQTGLTWTPPSPNIPTAESAFGCAMTGCIGELGILSVGIGTDAPFLRLGSHLLNGDTLYAVARRIYPPEVTIVREDFTAPFGDSVKFYHGIRFKYPEDKNVIPHLWDLEFDLVAALLTDIPFAKAFLHIPPVSGHMFEKVTGTTLILSAIKSGPNKAPAALAQVLASSRKDETQFRVKRKKYLLYQE